MIRTIQEKCRKLISASAGIVTSWDYKDLTRQDSLKYNIQTQSGWQNHSVKLKEMKCHCINSVLQPSLAQTLLLLHHPSGYTVVQQQIGVVKWENHNWNTVDTIVQTWWHGETKRTLGILICGALPDSLLSWFLIMQEKLHRLEEVQEVFTTISHKE